jgi:hypothetical protein
MPFPDLYSPPAVNRAASRPCVEETGIRQPLVQSDGECACAMQPRREAI